MLNLIDYLTLIMSGFTISNSQTQHTTGAYDAYKFKYLLGLKEIFGDSFPFIWL